MGQQANFMKTIKRGTQRWSRKRTFVGARGLSTVDRTGAFKGGDRHVHKRRRGTNPIYEGMLWTRGQRSVFRKGQAAGNVIGGGQYGTTRG